MKKRTKLLIEKINKDIPDVNITQDTYFINFIECLKFDEFQRVIKCFNEFKKNC